jgi:hypothetical protein
MLYRVATVIIQLSYDKTYLNHNNEITFIRYW